MRDDFDLRWFQTGTDPERHELAEDLHPLNDAMTLNPVGFVERTPSGAYRCETVVRRPDRVASVQGVCRVSREARPAADPEPRMVEAFRRAHHRDLGGEQTAHLLS